MTRASTGRSGEWPFVLLVVLLALCLRIGYNLFFVIPGYVPEMDAREYSDIASSLASGAGYRLADGRITAIRPPLFPLLLAGVYRAFGIGNYAAGLMLEAVLGALLCAAGYWLTRSIGGVAAGRIAGLILATYPLLIFSGTSLLSEPLFVLLVTWAAVAAVRTLDRPGPGSALVTGMWLGLAWLARPNGAALLPFVALWLLLADRRSVRSRLATVGLVIAASVVVAAPWIVRNTLSLGKFIPTTTMSGAVLFGSNNERVLAEPALHGDWVSPCEVPGAGWTCALDEIGRDEAWSQLGVAFISSHLPDLPRMIWWRFVKFWHLYPFTRELPEVLGHLYYVAIAALAVLGSWQLRRQWRRAGILWTMIACFMVTALLFWGGFRIRLPAEPALISLAAVALTSLPQTVRRRTPGQQEC